MTTMGGAKTCPACGDSTLSEIYHLDSVPTQSGVLLNTREEALSYPTAPLALALCEGCGFVFNTAFDSTLVDYAAASEESQHFSSTFNHFAERLVTELAEARDLHERFVVEIGCGKGDFLAALVATTSARGLGIDPGFLPDRFAAANNEVARTGRIAFRREAFDPATIAVRPDLVLCRHTLEHIGPVGHFIADIARLTAAVPEATLFFETPDMRRILDEGAFWDIYYEHCSYFSEGSQARLLRRHGFEVTRSRLDYENQYIIQHARVATGLASPCPAEADLNALRALAHEFPARTRAVRAHWAGLVRDHAAAGRRVAIWGGGSKAVAFLTTDGVGEAVADVVDINPFKHGRYLPGTGHCIVAPDDLRSTQPDIVIVMNRAYINEVAEQLSGMGLSINITNL